MPGLASAVDASALSSSSLVNSLLYSVEVWPLLKLRGLHCSCCLCLRNSIGKFSTLDTAENLSANISQFLTVSSLRVPSSSFRRGSGWEEYFPRFLFILLDSGFE